MYSAENDICDVSRQAEKFYKRSYTGSGRFVTESSTFITLRHMHKNHDLIVWHSGQSIGLAFQKQVQ